MKKTTLTLTALFALTAPTWAQPEGEGSLKQARDLFGRVDRDGDARISALEAGRQGIPSKDFVAYDADRDRKLSRSEFTLFYRQLIISAGKDVDEDLAAEAARITAARRAKKDQDAERTEEARQKALEDAKRVEAARQAKIAEDQARAEKARQAQERVQSARGGQESREQAGTDQGTGSPTPVVPPAGGDPGATGPTDAERAESARAEKAAQDAARAEKARQDAARAEQARLEKARLDAERAEAVRLAKAADEAARSEAAREEARRAEAARKGVQPKPANPEQRAAAYVRRLVDGGRMTQAQAKDFHAVLTADGPAANPAALRSSLIAAKKRISSFVVAGSLTSDEGRELANALDLRAKAALPVETPGPAGRRVGAGPRTTDASARKTGDARPADSGPADSRRGNDGARKQGRDQSGQGTGSRRATEKKDAGTRKPVRTGDLGGKSSRGGR